MLLDPGSYLFKTTGLLQCHGEPLFLKARSENHMVFVRLLQVRCYYQLVTQAVFSCFSLFVMFLLIVFWFQIRLVLFVHFTLNNKDFYLIKSVVGANECTSNAATLKVSFCKNWGNMVVPILASFINVFSFSQQLLVYKANSGFLTYSFILINIVP